MIIAFTYFIEISVIIFAIGISGIAASRNFLIMMLSVEVAIAASTLLAISFFSFIAPGNIVILLVAIWSVASAEVMALVTFYRYLVRYQISLDVSKLSKLKN